MLHASSVQRELDIRRKIVDVMHFLRGKLNTNELRHPDICKFHLDLMSSILRDNRTYSIQSERVDNSSDFETRCMMQDAGLMITPNAA